MICHMTMNEISCDLICMCFRIYPHEFWIVCIAVSSSPTPALKVLTVESIYRSWTEHWRPFRRAGICLRKKDLPCQPTIPSPEPPGSIFTTTPAFSPLYHAYYSSQCFAHLFFFTLQTRMAQSASIWLYRRFVFICFHSSISLLTLRPVPIPPILKTEITTHRFPLCSAFPAFFFFSASESTVLLSSHEMNSHTSWAEPSYHRSITLIPYEQHSHLLDGIFFDTKKKKQIWR